MSVPPEGMLTGPVTDLLRATRRRLTSRDAVMSIALAVVVATVLRGVGMLWLGSSRGLDLSALVAGAVICFLHFRRSATRRTSAAAARAAERAFPAFRNLLITAEELARHPDRAEPSMRVHVVRLAAHRATQVDGRVVVVARQFVAPMLAIALAGMANLALSGRLPASDVLDRVAVAISQLAGSSDTVDVSVTVTPPAYLGDAPRRLTNPQRIEALTGSRLAFAVASGAEARVRFGSAELTSSLEHVVRASGYFVIETEGHTERRFVSLTATPDTAPSVRISAPGKDMLIAAGDRTIPIEVTASDDLALRSLELRFTKVSGSGEQFEFEEGNLPITITRPSGREWRGRGALSLPRLRLAPGDSLVYRAVSRDGRPGDDGLASSDTYFVEVLGPGQAALEGVEMPPELERYGLSQQMIVLKLERLRAQERELLREPLTEQLASIAAEQRTVRANFIFLLGGHVEDEFEEAEQSHEIQEGRLENTARRDINLAVAHMTRAEQGMTAINTQVALTSAREAVTALQRAFGRNRYLLRSLAVRSRLDPARRLTGDTKDAADWRRILDAEAARAGDQARALLDAVLSAGQRWRSAPEVPKGEVEELAERLLAADPSVVTWQQAAQRLLDARNDPASPALRQVIDDVVALLRDEAARGVLRRTPAPVRGSPLQRAYQAEGRR